MNPNFYGTHYRYVIDKCRKISTELKSPISPDIFFISLVMDQKQVKNIGIYIYYLCTYCIFSQNYYFIAKAAQHSASLCRNNVGYYSFTF